MKQASQLAFDGKTRIYRWFVYFGSLKLATWAESESAARTKAEGRSKFKGLKADRVEPAPGLGDNQ